MRRVQMMPVRARLLKVQRKINQKTQQKMERKKMAVKKPKRRKSTNTVSGYKFPRRLTTVL